MRKLLISVAICASASAAFAFNIGMPPMMEVLETQLKDFDGDISGIRKAYEKATVEISENLGDPSQQPDCVPPTMTTWTQLGRLVNGSYFSVEPALTLLGTFKKQAEACREDYRKLGLDN